MSTMPPVHPAADKFPMMGESELAALADDIKQNGQRIPIQMIDGAILDGRNRWRACELAGVAPVTQNWTVQPPRRACPRAGATRQRSETMLQDDRTTTKNLSDGVPVPVADAAAVELRGGRLLSRPVLLYAAGFALAAALTGCTTLGGPQVQGAAVRVQLSNGQPLDVIVVGGGRR